MHVLANWFCFNENPINSPLAVIIRSYELALSAHRSENCMQLKKISISQKMQFQLSLCWHGRL